MIKEIQIRVNLIEERKENILLYKASKKLGLDKTEIDKQLFISKNTVKYHIRNIYTKTDVNNRTELKEKLLDNNKIKITKNQLINTYT